MTTAPTYAEASAAPRRSVQTATLGVLIALSASHMLNDVMQSLAPALYPVFRQEFALSFFQIGLITFVFQLTASFLQPVIGLSLDKRPLNWILPVGMAFTLVGLVLLAFAGSYLGILLSVAVVGIGSAVFHPEASRVARAASGGRHGFAQSLFQVGGNFGQSLGPLLAAFIVVPFGQHSVLIFTALALAAVIILTGVSRWYAAIRAGRKKASVGAAAHPRRVVVRTLIVLIVMLFSKVLYLSSLNSYYTFYLIQTFGVSIQGAQVLLFVFLAAVAAGTFLGGPLVDRFGAKFVIWGSILGVLPFTLLLPHLGLVGTVINSIAIGLIISSAFSAMVVYAQELTPGNVGAVAGLFFGLSFGLGGVGAAALGMLADKTSLTFVYHVCAFLPAVGLLGGFLPDPRAKAAAAA
ncbi:MAG TPA: MFS transporter [Roseiarcus sp.]|nr:MFS transporter [Roseiarcus sp.]